MPKFPVPRRRCVALIAIGFAARALAAGEPQTTETPGAKPIVFYGSRNPAAAPIAPLPVAATQPKSGATEIRKSSPEFLETAMVPAWTLGDLEQLALQNNPTIGRGRAAIAAQQGNRYQVGLQPNPQVGYSGQQLGSGGLAEQHGVAFQQEIVRRDKLTLNRTAASQLVERTRLELVAQEQRVITDVRIQFFDALIAEKRLKLAGELLRLSERSFVTSQKLFKAGETARHNVLQAEITIEASRNVHASAENHYRAALRALSAIAGVPNLEKHPLQGDAEDLPPPIDWETTLQRTISTSPEMATVAVEVERTRAVWSRASVETQPNMIVQGLYNAVDNGIGGKPDGAVQIMLPVPLWNKNQGAINQAYNDYVAAQQNVAVMELDLKNRLAPVFERYQTTGQQVARYREKILPTAKESVDLVEKGYAAGEFPYDNVLDSLRIFNEANQNYLDALRDHHAARAEIEGLLLKNSLSTK